MNKKKLLYTRKIAEEKKTDIVLCAFQRFLRDKIASVFLIKLSCSAPGLRKGVATFLIPYCCRCGFKKIQWFFMKNQLLSICHSPNPIQDVSFQGCSRMGGGMKCCLFCDCQRNAFWTFPWIWQFLLHHLSSKKIPTGQVFNMCNTFCICKVFYYQPDYKNDAFP